MPKQTMPVFYINKTKFKPKAAGQKSEREIFNWVTLSIYNTLGFKYAGVI